MNTKKQIASKILACTVATTIGVSALAPTSSVFASEKDIIINNELGSDEMILNQELINKVDSYIKTNNQQFYLDETAYQVLNEKEIEIVSEQINKVNLDLKLAFPENVVTQGNTFKVLPDLTQAEVNASSRASRNYMYVDYAWWGAQIYFSHAAVKDMNDFFTISGATSGMSAFLFKEFLKKNGLTLSNGYLATISLFGGIIAFTMSKIDRGKGVYLDCYLYVPARIKPV